MLTPFRPERTRQGEQGQMLILFVVFFSALLAVAVFAVDQGVWLGKRRVAQKDADTAARGGAMAYLQGLAYGSAAAVAESEAEKTADKNGVDISGTTATSFTASPDCQTFRGDIPPSIGVPSIHVAINSPTKSLFGRIFGIDELTDLGAQATACVGIATIYEGLDPYYIAPGGITDPCFDGTDRPNIGVTCVFKTASQPQEVGSRGNLSLAGDATACTQKSKKELREQIEEGSGAICEVGDEINVAEGNNTAANTSGLQCRLLGPASGLAGCDALGEGFCDDAEADGGYRDPDGSIPPFTTPLTGAGIDDFTEVFSTPPPNSAAPGSNWASQAGVLTENICSNGKISPRIMTFAIVDAPADAGGGTKTVTLKELAVFYVFGCVHLDQDGNPDQPIDVQCTDSANSGIIGMFVDAHLPEGGGVLLPPVPGASLSIVLVK